LCSIKTTHSDVHKLSGIRPSCRLSSDGHLSVIYGITDGWSPAMASFYTVLHSLAPIVIFGPELEVTNNPAAPQPYYRCHALEGLIFLAREGLDNTDDDWIVRVTNLFSRVYNRIDDNDNIGDFADGIEGSDVFREITNSTDRPLC
jgi:hypothetical protein